MKNKYKNYKMLLDKYLKILRENFKIQNIIYGNARIQSLTTSKCDALYKATYKIQVRFLAFELSLVNFCSLVKFISAEKITLLLYL